MPRPLRHDLAALGLAGLAAIVLAGAYATFRIWQQGQVDDWGQPVDAIVVLGAAQYDGVPSPVFRARIDHATELFFKGVAPVLITTGGRQPGDRVTEAQTARAYAIRVGVPASAIVMEDTGRDTLESLRNVAAIFAAHGWQRAMFVSDRTHMLRVERMATDLGLVAFGSPTPSSPVEADAPALADAYVHELGGLAAYLLSR